MIDLSKVVLIGAALSFGWAASAYAFTSFMMNAYRLVDWITIKVRALKSPKPPIP